MKLVKRGLALCVAMVLAAVLLPVCRPAAAAAADALTIENGTLVACDPSAAGELVIPEGVTKIGGNAFKDCVLLERVVLPEGVTKIGGYAFKGCELLERVVLPEGVEEIGGYAFSGCTALYEMHIPQSMKIIKAGAFAGCTSLTAFSLSEGNTRFVERDGVLYSISGAHLAFYPSGRRTAEFRIPDGVESMRESAFEGALYLETLIAPASLRQIGAKAFVSCGALRRVTLAGAETIGQSAFSNCVSLVQVTLPDTLKTIDIKAFYGCRRLSELRLPKGLEKIGGYAFADCVGLRSITFGATTSVGPYAFKGCVGVTSLVLEEGCTWVPEIDGEQVRSVSLPSTINSLSLWLFKAMCGDSLQTVSFANTPARWDDLVQAALQTYALHVNAKEYIEGHPREKVQFVSVPTAAPTTQTTPPVTTTATAAPTTSAPTETTTAADTGTTASTFADAVTTPVATQPTTVASTEAVPTDAVSTPTQTDGNAAGVIGVAVAAGLLSVIGAIVLWKVLSLRKKK